MASDKNLIQASFTQAQTKYGIVDQSKVYQATVDIGREYSTLISGILSDMADKKEKLKLEKERQLEKFTAISEANLQKLYNDKEPLPEAIIDAIEGRIVELQDDFEKVNTIGKNDTKENARARRKILGELTRITTNATNIRADYMKFSETSKDFNMNRVDRSIIDPSLMVIDLENMDQNVADGNMKVWYDKNGINFSVSNYNTVDDGEGNITKSGDAVTITMDILKDNFKGKNTELDTKYIAMLNNSTARGTRDGQDINSVFDYDINGQKALFKEIIKTSEDFADFSQRNIEGLNDEPAFDDYLLKNLDISFNVLENMFYDENGQRVNVGEIFKGLDIDNDQDVDTDDIIAAGSRWGKDSEEYKKFEYNVNALIDAFVNPNNPAFDLKLSTDMLTDYYVEYDQRAYTSAYNIASKKTDNFYNSGSDRDDEDSPNMWIGGQWIPREDFNTHKDFILNPEDGETSEWMGYNYKYENGKFYREPRFEGETGWIETNEEQMTTEGRLSRYIKNPTGKYSKKNPEVVRREKFNGVKAIEFIEMGVDDVIKNLNKHYYTLNKKIMKTKSGNLAIYIGGKYREYKKPTNEKELDRLLLVLSSNEFTDEIGEAEVNTDYN